VGVTYSGSSPEGSYNNVSRTVTWDLGSVIPDACLNLTLTVDVNVGIANGTMLNNLADAEWSYGSDNYGPVEADWQTEINTHPQLTIVKTGTEEARGGDTITWEIEITNVGGATAENVTLTDILPLHLNYLSSIPSGSEADGVITWSLANIASGGSVTVEVQAEVDFGMHENTVLINTAIVNWEDVEGEPYGPETATASTLVGPALTITKTAALQYAFPGDTITYTISYENTSTVNLTGVVVTETYDANVDFVSADPGPDLSTNNKWTIGALNAGDSGTIQVVVRVKSTVSEGVILRNDVNISSFEGAQGEDDDKVDARYPPDLQAAKTGRLYADPNKDGMPSLGDTLEYTIIIKNNGEGQATGVVFTDTPDPLTSLVPGSVSTSQGIVTGGNNGIPPVTISVGTVDPGASITITFRVIIDEVSYLNFVVNQGHVISIELPDIPTDDHGWPGSQDPTITHLGLRYLVGGEVQSINRSMLWARWLGLPVILIAGLAATLIVRRRVRRLQL
jgi:large repetitive protein